MIAIVKHLGLDDEVMVTVGFVDNEPDGEFSEDCVAVYPQMLVDGEEMITHEEDAVLIHKSTIVHVFPLHHVVKGSAQVH